MATLLLRPIIFCGTDERNGGYALLITNKPETVLCRAPTFSLLIASHMGISSCACVYVELHVGVSASVCMYVRIALL